MRFQLHTIQLRKTTSDFTKSLVKTLITHAKLVVSVIHFKNISLRHLKTAAYYWRIGCRAHGSLKQVPTLTLDFNQRFRETTSCCGKTMEVQAHTPRETPSNTFEVGFGPVLHACAPKYISKTFARL